MCTPIVFLIFCCWVTNYHKFSCLKQYQLIILQFWRWELWVSWTGFFTWSLTSAKSRGWAGLLLVSLGKNPLPGSFNLLTEFSSLQLEDWGLHFLVGSQFLKTPCNPWHVAPSICRANSGTSSSLCALNLWLPLLPLAGVKISAFQGLMWLDWVHPEDVPLIIFYNIITGVIPHHVCRSHTHSQRRMLYTRTRLIIGSRS